MEDATKNGDYREEKNYARFKTNTSSNLSSNAKGNNAERAEDLFYHYDNKESIADYDETQVSKQYMGEGFYPESYYKMDDSNQEAASEYDLGVQYVDALEAREDGLDRQSIVNEITSIRNDPGNFALDAVYLDGGNTSNINRIEGMPYTFLRY